MMRSVPTGTRITTPECAPCTSSTPPIGCSWQWSTTTSPRASAMTSGRIEVIAEARGDVVVDHCQEHPMGGVLEVQGAHSGVVMRVPVGTDLIIGSHSGSVKLHGQLGNVRITTRSGSLAI